MDRREQAMSDPLGCAFAGLETTMTRHAFPNVSIAGTSKCECLEHFRYRDQPPHVLVPK